MPQTFKIFILIFALLLHYCCPEPRNALVLGALLRSNLYLTFDFVYHLQSFCFVTSHSTSLCVNSSFTLVRQVRCAPGLLFNCIRALPPPIYLLVDVSGSLLQGSDLLDAASPTAYASKPDRRSSMSVCCTLGAGTVREQNWFVRFSEELFHWSIVNSGAQPSLKYCDAPLISRFTSPCSSQSDSLFSMPAPFHAFGT